MALAAIGMVITSDRTTVFSLLTLVHQEECKQGRYHLMQELNRLANFK